MKTPFFVFPMDWKSPLLDSPPWEESISLQPHALIDRFITCLPGFIFDRFQFSLCES